ncbi:putative surface-anchored membrane protein [Corynebacterium kutscheri]|uniref:Surface-anchored membrane protein n=1 Tax=Corynebacterium kutscheri TaxID=35755 RepID=A0A0F6R0R5_9CORY|nr:type VII secretion integral membrane protein EccD [Corynebacterium kutscheri]AKE40608.1 type VII secretion integral membrane protein EccD [Corynebacterium kutscheri]VEH04859.1 putative surface-anchored membrane protein [Corynebacterium kutscheri]VEH11005.1 putative surface-anchored membrane protein [Corynebacterium kutscheri]VEH80515.1 putative surface-anchored membrane protein [Corynebacterium kutscheri]
MALIDHNLRVHVRVDLGDDVSRIREGTDLSLPATSSISEILPDILKLIDAPHITVSWQARTASGTIIDPALALIDAGLHHGSIILLSPKRQQPLETASDTAEAIEQVSSRHKTKPHTYFSQLFEETSVCAGIFGLSILSFQFSHTLPLVISGSVLSTLCLGLVLARASFSYVPLTAVISSVSLVLAIFGFPGAHTQRLESALLILVVVISIIVISGIGLWLKHCVLQEGAALITFCLCIAFAAISIWLYRPGIYGSEHGWLIGAAALVLSLATTGMIIAPRIATALVGLRVPQLPSGAIDQPITTCDSQQAIKALNASQLFDGIMAGLGLSCSGALLLIMLYPDHQSGFLQALCLVIGGALIIHSHRYISPIALWATWIPGIISIATAACCVQAHWLSIVAAVLPILTLATTPLWARFLATTTPTTLQWIERGESLMIAASLPLTLHLMGIFALIRGLGA